jgi:hypothetical protein
MTQIINEVKMVNDISYLCAYIAMHWDEYGEILVHDFHLTPTEIASCIYPLYLEDKDKMGNEIAEYRKLKLCVVKLMTRHLIALLRRGDANFDCNW